MKPDIKEIKRQAGRILNGSILSEDFFLKNIRFMFLIFIIIILYINNRYNCISEMGEIQTLRKELSEIKYESQTISTELIGISRRSQLQSLVEKNGIGLEISKQPAFEIDK